MKAIATAFLFTACALIAAAADEKKPIDVTKPDSTTTSGPVGGGFKNYVHKAEKAGTYEIEVTPIYMDKEKKGTTSKFKLEVK